MPSLPARPVSSEGTSFSNFWHDEVRRVTMGCKRPTRSTIPREAGMRALIRRLWQEHRARKYARRRYREELSDRREAEHLERQRAGIRDVRGPSF